MNNEIDHLMKAFYIRLNSKQKEEAEKTLSELIVLLENIVTFSNTVQNGSVDLPQDSYKKPLREDVVVFGLKEKIALQNAPRKFNSYILVPPVQWE